MIENLTFFANTDVGLRRTNNEDAFVMQNIWDENHILSVVIDGVGGYEGGEVASALAKKLIVEYLERYSNGERLELLKQAVIYANNGIYAERKNLPQYSNMSCVLTAVLVEVEEKCIHMAHVGDTRLYQFVDNQLQKLSHDHSLVGYMEEIGELTEEEAMKHPQRNIIGRDVGSNHLESSGNAYVETATFPLSPQSKLLLCSDGLCDMIRSAQMTEILMRQATTEEKVTALIDAANEAGGKDNVTVVLIELDFEEEAQVAVEEQPVIEETKEEVRLKISAEELTEKLPEGVSPQNNMRCFLLCVTVILGLLIAFSTGVILGYKLKMEVCNDTVQIYDVPAETI